MSFHFCFLNGGGGDGLDSSKTLLSSSSEQKMPASEYISHKSNVPLFIGGVELGDSSEVSRDWGLSLSAHWRPIGCTTSILARMLSRLGGIFKSFKLGDYGALPCVTVENSGLVSVWVDCYYLGCLGRHGWDGNSFPCVYSWKSMELGVFGVLFRSALWSPDNCFN